MNQVITKRGDIFDTLAAIDKGGLVHELEGACREAVLASVQTMKKSKVVVELSFDPDTKTEAMRVSAAVKMSLPVAPKKAALFFPTPEGNLSRMDARQRDIEDYLPQKTGISDVGTETNNQ